MFKVRKVRVKGKVWKRLVRTPKIAQPSGQKVGLRKCHATPLEGTLVRSLAPRSCDAQVEHVPSGVAVACRALRMNMNIYIYIYIGI